MIDALSRHERLVFSILGAIIGLILVGIFYQLIINGNKVDRNHNTGLTNQTYDATSTCLLSRPPTDRNVAYIKQCYNRAEKITGVKVQRFGDGQ